VGTDPRLRQLEKVEQEYEIREKQLRAQVAVVQTDLELASGYLETRKQELQVCFASVKQSAMLTLLHGDSR
jgi:hypothetical protein